MTTTPNSEKESSQEPEESTQLSTEELEGVSGGLSECGEGYGPARRGAVAGGSSPEEDIDGFASQETDGETEKSRRS